VYGAANKFCTGPTGAAKAGQKSLLPAREPNEPTKKETFLYVLKPCFPQFQQSQLGPPLSSLSGRTVDGPDGGAADEVRVLLVHRLQLHPHLEPVHLGRGRLLLEAPAIRDGATIRVADPDPNSIRIQSGQWIRIRIQEGKNAPKKEKKIKKFHVSKCWMFSFES
jgi:hypothetical protein